jgi:hypothetical protein
MDRGLVVGTECLFRSPYRSARLSQVGMGDGKRWSELLLILGATNPSRQETDLVSAGSGRKLRVPLVNQHQNDSPMQIGPRRFLGEIDLCGHLRGRQVEGSGSTMA